MKIYSYDHTIDKLKYIKNNYENLSGCYSSKLGGCFELLCGSTILDKSNIVVLDESLFNNGIESFVREFNCGKFLLHLTLETVLELDDDKLELVNDMLVSLKECTTLDEYLYDSMKREHDTD